MSTHRQQEFVLAHREDDVHQLMLAARRYPGIDLAAAAEQISGWQTARKKLPLWADTPGVLFPTHLSMEQCSSQQAAAYKASIVAGGESMADLTGGFGVDATMIGRKYGRLLFVEHDEELCRLARNNLPLLGISNAEVLNEDAAKVVADIPHQQLIYLDPARRNRYGGKVIAIGDCTPDVSMIQTLLLQKADTVLIKLSPMLDLKTIERELHHIREIHIVSIAGECKEILVKMSADDGLTSVPAPFFGSLNQCSQLQTAQQSTIFPIRYVCVNIKDGQHTTGTDVRHETFSFTTRDEQQATCHYAEKPLRYIYEPNASIMKAGCFRSLAHAYHLLKLHPNSHLFTCDELRQDFPGRIFQTIAVSTLNRHETKALLAGIRQANITVRNFPLSSEALHKRLKLRDGGDSYIFATTLLNGQKVIILTEKHK